jgi:hypothetical protein
MIAIVKIGGRRVGMLSFNGSTAAGCHTPRYVQTRTFGSALALLLVAGCGGSPAPKSDAGAVAQVLKDAAKAVAERDGEKACSYMTPDAQRQLILQVGAAQAFGNIDCETLIGRATAFLTPLDKKQIESLEPTGVQVSGTGASATMASSTGAAAGQGTSVQLNLQKVGSDWKVSGFVDAQGLPGGG